ncbi:MAG: N-acetylmuramoyl-L-alanine amidase, partial [Candidatus Limnocylindrales bacterium]
AQMRPRVGLLVAALMLALLPALLPAGAMPASAATNQAINSFTVSGSPFAPALAPLPDHVTINLTLARRARVTLKVLTEAGVRVRVLAKRVRLRAGQLTWMWDGRDASGALTADGKYVVRIAAITAAGTERQERTIRMGLPPIYPANPGALVIVVDPGHGGRYPGAVRDGFMEKDFNLDIGLKLGALLAQAGVQVVMTRTTDNALDEPPTDRNGDGVFNRYDDDLARNDVANLARADVALHVHNNASSNSAAHGTATYTDGNRTWTLRENELAAFVLTEEFAALQAYRSPQFTPVNAGTHHGWYYYMGPYDPPFLTRPALMTSILSESLFVSNAAELEALKRPDIRTSIAAAIYIGLARWINSRDLGIGYELISGPSAPVASGSNVGYRIRVTNRGNAASNGWMLELRNIESTPLYDGSGTPGALMGSVAVPDGLAPGASVELDVSAVAPSAAGEWLIKSDVRLNGGSYASDEGVVAMQTAMTTAAD